MQKKGSSADNRQAHARTQIRNIIVAFSLKDFVKKVKS